VLDNESAVVQTMVLACLCDIGVDGRVVNGASASSVVPCSLVRRRVGGGANGGAHSQAQRRVSGGTDDGASALSVVPHLLAESAAVSAAGWRTVLAHWHDTHWRRGGQWCLGIHGYQDSTIILVLLLIG